MAIKAKDVTRKDENNIEIFITAGYCEATGEDHPVNICVEFENDKNDGACCIASITKEGCLRIFEGVSDYDGQLDVVGNDSIRIEYM